MPARAAAPSTRHLCVCFGFGFLAKSKLSANVNGSYGRLDLDQEQQQSWPFGCLNAAVIIAKSVYCIADSSLRFIEHPLPISISVRLLRWGMYS